MDRNILLMEINFIIEDNALFNSFLEFKEKQITIMRGNQLMYDVKGCYKYINENELFDYYYKLNKNLI